jgi:hypothetical protein
MTEEVEFRGLFRTSPKMSPVPGEWYLGFVCLTCSNRFAVLDDPNGTGGTKVSGRGAFLVTCPACGAAHSYAAERMVSFQVATAQPAAPIKDVGLG